MLAMESNYSVVVPSAESSDGAIIKSAHRVLQVFEYFAHVRRPSNATEIANALCFPQSSTSMLLRSMVSLGYLAYQADCRTFEPTIRLSLLGGWDPRRIDVAGDIIVRLGRLHAETGETVLLAHIDRNLVRYIYVLQKPASSVPYYFKLGTARPACMTAAGRMLMTLYSEREVMATIHRANAEEPDPAEWINRKQFLVELATCRRDRTCVTRRAFDDRIGVQMAALLPAEGGVPKFAVALVSEEPRFTANEAFLRERLAHAVAA
ncbi:helix-turn-helix domain-containing protein [Sphingobium sp. H39-3-25]|uniref:IclR family transcriptional regulator n=1 Tax=Sphingobium arseniciresistens TaxID=3030834 RepID=UPI0023B8A395|nr:helix-turn-helix domain-containing protein [Sphingobium arseniciresistens]